MNRDKLKILQEQKIIKELYVYEETSSTNDRAKEHARELVFSNPESGLTSKETDTTNFSHTSKTSGVSTGSNTSDPSDTLPALYISEVQTIGRGRMGRSWQSPAGSGIWMSYLFKTELEPEKIPGITLLASLAVVRGISSYISESTLLSNSSTPAISGLSSSTSAIPRLSSRADSTISGLSTHSTSENPIAERILHKSSSPETPVSDGKPHESPISTRLLNETLSQIGIKWPNDIVINGKKICGILTELVAPSFVICGIGINVNTREFPDELSEKATSLFLETGHVWDREKLVIKIISELSLITTEYEKNKSLDFIQSSYNDLLININREVVLTGDNPGIPSGTYISRGIDSTGALLVEDSHGTVTPVSSGEVSVRGLYGYT